MLCAKRQQGGNITLPLLVTEGILLTLGVELSFATQLLETDDVVDETPDVTVWFALSTFIVIYLANGYPLLAYTSCELEERALLGRIALVKTFDKMQYFQVKQ